MPEANTMLINPLALMVMPLLILLLALPDTWLLLLGQYVVALEIKEYREINGVDVLISQYPP